MADYTLLECGQAQAVSGNTDMRINQISRTPIKLLPGDEIGVEMASIAQQGSDGDTVEVSATFTELGLLDNSQTLHSALYVNHCGRQTQRLPFRNSRVYVGPRNPFGHPTHSAILGLRSRRLGLPDINRGFSSAQPDGSGNELEMPSKNLHFELELQTGGSHYQAGRVYALTYATIGPPVAEAVSGIQIKVLTTRIVPPTVAGQPDILGVIDTYIVHKMGSLMGTSLPEAFPRNMMATLASGVSNAARATFTLRAFPSENVYTRNCRGPDGERYYFDQIASQGPTRDVFTYRETASKVTVPQGFFVPDTLASLVTNSLQAPTPVPVGTSTDFVDLSNYEFGTAKGAVLTETPTLRLTGCETYRRCAKGLAL